MPSSRSNPPAGAWLLAAGLATVVAALAPAIAQADGPDYCVANTVAAPCPSGTTYNASSFADLLNYWDTNPASNGATVQVEPGTYAGQVVLNGPTDLDVYGDPAQTAYPVITSSAAQ